MIKFEGSARFGTPSAAIDAVTALAELRHDPGNAIIGGGHALHADDDGRPTVTVSYRLRTGTDDKTVDRLIKQVSGILGGTDLERGHVWTDTEHVVNPNTGRVEQRQANRVVQDLPDGTQRTLTVRESLADVVDPDTGEKVGTVPVRSMVDTDGNKVQFDGPRGATDPSVTVEKQ